MARPAPRPPPAARKRTRVAGASKAGMKVAGPRAPDETELARFVEHTGMIYESLGMPPMAGRIVGRLLVCDPPHQSMSELQAALRASKGSISTMTRLLQAAGLVERVPMPHDRREYVRVPPFAFERLVSQMTERTARIRRLAEEGLELLRGAPAARRERLVHMRDFHLFIEREIPRVLARFGTKPRAR